MMKVSSSDRQAMEDEIFDLDAFLSRYSSIYLFFSPCW